MALTKQGFNVTSAASSAAALASAARQEFGLYLPDVWMPDFDSIELCKRISEFDQSTPILFYSAAAFSSDIDAAKEAGAQGYVNQTHRS